MLYEFLACYPSAKLLDIVLPLFAKSLKLPVRRPVIPNFKSPYPLRDQLTSAIATRTRSDQVTPYSILPVNQREIPLAANLHHELTHDHEL